MEPDSVNDQQPASYAIEGSEFVKTEIILDVGVDINGDGVFSTHLSEETFVCYEGNLRFTETHKIWHPLNDIFEFNITDDANGNLNQGMNCSHADGAVPKFRQIEDIIEIYYEGFDHVVRGTLSENNTKLTFVFTFEDLWFFSNNPSTTVNDILRPNGSIEDYEGGAVQIYTKL